MLDLKAVLVVVLVVGGLGLIALLLSVANGFADTPDKEGFHDAEALNACLASCPQDPGVNPVCSCSNRTYPTLCAARCHEPWSARFDEGPCRALPFLPQPPCDRCGCPPPEYY